MLFKVPKGQSLICHYNVYPLPPEDGMAQEWRVVCTTREEQDIDWFDIEFSRGSSPLERQYERMIMVFTIPEALQTDEFSWRFVHGGVMFCNGGEDYRDDLAFDMSADGMVLTATARALSDGDEKFQFSFLALRRDNRSGECQVYASADPGGKIKR